MTRAWSASSSMGLDSNSYAPRRMPSRAASTEGYPVRMSASTSGRRVFISRSVSRPSMPGMLMSSTTRAMSSFPRKAARPSSPEAAVETANPRDARRLASTAVSPVSSSTRSTVFPAMDGLLPISQFSRVIPWNRQRFKRNRLAAVRERCCNTAFPWYKGSGRTSCRAKPTA
ncbi:hypothetical protein DSECCO2_617720 [anaerobic digester metagenome]